LVLLKKESGFGCSRKKRERRIPSAVFNLSY